MRQHGFRSLVVGWVFLVATSAVATEPAPSGMKIADPLGWTPIVEQFLGNQPLEEAFQKGDSSRVVTIEAGRARKLRLTVKSVNQDRAIIQTRSGLFGTSRSSKTVTRAQWDAAHENAFSLFLGELQTVLPTYIADPTAVIHLEAAMPLKAYLPEGQEVEARLVMGTVTAEPTSRPLGRFEIIVGRDLPAHASIVSFRFEGPALMTSTKVQSFERK